MRFVFTDTPTKTESQLAVQRSWGAFPELGAVEGRAVEATVRTQRERGAAPDTAGSRAKS